MCQRWAGRGKRSLTILPGASAIYQPAQTGRELTRSTQKATQSGLQKCGWLLWLKPRCGGGQTVLWAVLVFVTLMACIKNLGNE